MISTRDEQLALAQQQVFRSRQKYLRAKARLERDIKRRDELRPVARAHKAVKNIYDAVKPSPNSPRPNRHRHWTATRAHPPTRYMNSSPGQATSTT